MSFLLHLLIVLCGLALMPEDATPTTMVLFLLMQLLIMIFNYHTFKQGILVGKQIVWEVLAKTMAEKNIESVIIKQKANHDQ